jgi:hypothetical protein
MKKILFAISLLFSCAAFGQQGHYGLAQNDLINLKGHAFGIDNNGDTIRWDTTNRIILMKPVVLKAYATGSMPSIPNSMVYRRWRNGSRIASRGKWWGRFWAYVFERANWINANICYRDFGNRFWYFI